MSYPGYLFLEGSYPSSRGVISKLLASLTEREEKVTKRTDRAQVFLALNKFHLSQSTHNERDSLISRHRLTEKHTQTDIILMNELWAHITGIHMHESS